MNELRLPKDLVNRFERRWAARFGQSWHQKLDLVMPRRTGIEIDELLPITVAFICFADTRSLDPKRAPDDAVHSSMARM
jgi:hypothetical protein